MPYRIPIKYLTGSRLESPTEYPTEYPIDTDFKNGKPVRAQDLRTPQLNCSFWVRDSYEENLEPRRIVLQLPYGIPAQKKRSYRIPLVQSFMEYPTAYPAECPIEYHLECPVVEYLTEYRLCNIPSVYLECTS